jgi:hypothetical protein
MFFYRITKYNPHDRTAQGFYLNPTWTSCSDIGKTYDGNVFSADDYMKVEDLYVAVIRAFMECQKIRSLTITALEKRAHISQSLVYSQDMLALSKEIFCGQRLPNDLVAQVARLALREDIWCKLEEKSLKVHFGYDYYLYISSSRVCSNVITGIEKSGLFIEQIDRLPYENID